MGARLLSVIAVIAMIFIGCLGITNAKTKSAEFADSALGMLNKGLASLTVNIEHAGKRIEELNQFPDAQDSLL